MKANLCLSLSYKNLCTYYKPIFIYKHFTPFHLLPLPGWRRSDRTQNHRRHVRRLGRPRWRCLLRQGLHQGRSIGGLRSPLGGQVAGQGRSPEALPRPGLVRHRSGRAIVHYRFRLRHLEPIAEGADGDRAQELWSATRQDRQVSCLKTKRKLWF